MYLSMTRKLHISTTQRVFDFLIRLCDNRWPYLLSGGLYDYLHEIVRLIVQPCCFVTVKSDIACSAKIKYLTILYTVDV